MGQEVVSRRKEGTVSGKMTLPQGKGPWSYHANSIFWAHVTDYLIGDDGNILDGLLWSHYLFPGIGRNCYKVCIGGRWLHLGLFLFLNSTAEGEWKEDPYLDVWQMSFALTFQSSMIVVLMVYICRERGSTVKKWMRSENLHIVGILLSERGDEWWCGWRIFEVQIYHLLDSTTQIHIKIEFSLMMAGSFFKKEVIFDWFHLLSQLWGTS